MEQIRQLSTEGEQLKNTINEKNQENFELKSELLFFRSTYFISVIFWFRTTDGQVHFLYFGYIFIVTSEIDLPHSHIVLSLVENRSQGKNNAVI